MPITEAISTIGHTRAAPQSIGSEAMGRTRVWAARDQYTESDGRGHRMAALNPADLLLPERPPAERHPADAYLAHRTPRSRDATRKPLDTIASVLTSGQASAPTRAWHRPTHAQVTDLGRTLL